MSTDSLTKKSVVLDTNFIIEHNKDLPVVIEKLSVDSVVYVTEISVNERIYQKYIEIKEKYEKIDKFRESYSNYATVVVKKPFESLFDDVKKATQQIYNKQFGDKIIEFHPQKTSLVEIMERVYKKIPPFLNIDNASDKGFKDTLLWMSIVNYFKSRKSDVILITNDRGFLNYIEILQKEFTAITGNNIEISGSNYYVEVNNHTTEVFTKMDNATKGLSETEKKDLRDKISLAFNHLCQTEYEDLNYGDNRMAKSFTTSSYYTIERLENALENMNAIIQDHILENEINASVIFDSEFIRDIFKIPIQYIEDVVKLYHTIKSKYSDFLKPFLNAACEIINMNYQLDDDENNFPF